MADSLEKEIRIKATGDTAQAKTSIDDLSASTAALGEAQTEQTAATESATAATAEQTAEELRQQAVLDDHAALLRTLTDAQAAAAESVAAMAEAAAVGGATYTAAILAARDAVAQLEVAQEAVRAAGGPISPAAIAQLEAYDAAVEVAAVSTQKMSGAVNATSLEMNVARGSVGGVARALGQLTEAAGPALSALGKAGLVGLVVAEGLKLAIAAVEGLAKAWDWATNKIATFTSGMNDATKILDEHGKAIDPLSDKYQKAADAAANVTRAQYAMNAGVIATTDNLQKASAELVLHNAALHGWSLETDQARAALKAFGLQMPETFTQAQQDAQAFTNAYSANLKQSSLDAFNFAELNKQKLADIEAAFVKLGKDVPPELKKISDSIGQAIPTATEAVDKEIKNLQKSFDDLGKKSDDLNKKLADGAKAFVDHSKAVEADRQASIAAIDATTTKTVADLQKQVDETEAAHASRQISDTDYNTKINQLIADEQAARTNAYDAEQKINQDSEKAQADLATKHKEETTKITEDLSELTDKQKDAQKQLDLLNVSREAEVRALQISQPLLFQSGIDAKLLSDIHVPLATNTRASADATKILSDQFGAMLADVPALSSAVGGLIGQFDALAASATRAAAAVASVTDGGAS